MNNLPIIKFNPKLPKLTKTQQKVLKLLVEAGELIAPIYLEQEKQLVEDGNFYPKGVNQKEIEKAVKNNLDILSPFTVVEKIKGKLVTIPYHVKYEKFLKPIADKLIQAGNISDNKEFSKFLKLQARALLDGSYEQAIAAWQNMPPYILDISIGPMEHFDDRIFFKKAAYHAWVGVVDMEESERVHDYKNLIFSARREALLPGGRIDNYEKVKAKVDNVLLFSGHMARTKFVGMNLPMNLKLVEKYGSEVTIFKQINDLRMKEQILPSFKKIFSPAFRKGYSSEDLRLGSLRYVALHELAHNYLFYRDSAKRLQDLLPSIYELTATMLGMRIAGSLLLKDIINSKELESMIVAFICRSSDLIEKSKANKAMVNFASGGDIFINFMLENGAIKQKEGLTMPNFMKIFVSLHELSYILERLLALGTRTDAEIFIKRYGHLSKSS